MDFMAGPRLTPPRHGLTLLNALRRAQVYTQVFPPNAASGMARRARRRRVEIAWRWLPPGAAPGTAQGAGIKARVSS